MVERCPLWWLLPPAAADLQPLPLPSPAAAVQYSHQTTSTPITVRRLRLRAKKLSPNDLRPAPRRAIRPDKVPHDLEKMIKGLDRIVAVQDRPEQGLEGVAAWRAQRGDAADEQGPQTQSLDFGGVGRDLLFELDVRAVQLFDRVGYACAPGLDGEGDAVGVEECCQAATFGNRGVGFARSVLCWGQGHEAVVHCVSCLDQLLQLYG